MISKASAILIAALTSVVLQTSPASAQNGRVMPSDEVGAAVADVLETLARRKLTPEEIRATTEDYIPLFGDTECTARCIEMTEYNAQRILLAMEGKGGPEEALIQRISAEADPIMVVEPSPQRLMTRADVVASMNLYLFAQASGPPEARQFDESDIAAAAEMHQIYQSPSHIMSRHLPLAATYWAGLQRSWSGFTEDERALVRAYFANDRPQDPLPANLYTALLGLTPSHAQNFALQIFRDSMLDIAAQGAIVRMQMAILQSYTLGLSRY